jgi:hypothetical protein
MALVPQTLECVLWGDSLAVGVSWDRPDCRARATVGITSARFGAEMAATARARTAVISLGVNDSADIDTRAQLRAVRARVSAATVYWLLPGRAASARAREDVWAVARERSDRVIDVGPLAGPDGVHPPRDGYRQLAAMTRTRSAGVRAAGASYEAASKPPPAKPTAKR